MVHNQHSQILLFYWCGKFFSNFYGFYIFHFFSRHYSFGLDEPLSIEQNAKPKKRDPRDLNLDNFSRMITTCNNDLGSHILYNGPCDVIGRRVFSFVTEELELQIKYFEVFDSTIRPIHCAILLRNVTILDALTEESRQVEQIKRKNDVCNEKTFQKILHEKVTFLFRPLSF